MRGCVLDSFGSMAGSCEYCNESSGSINSGKLCIVFHMLQICSYFLLRNKSTTQIHLHSRFMIRHDKGFYDPGHSEKYLWLVMLALSSRSKRKCHGPHKKL